MFSPTDEAVRTRMITGQQHAAEHFSCTVAGEPVWGRGGTTIGTKTLGGQCPAWLRIRSAPAGHSGGSIWNGTATAAALMPNLSTARLLGVHDWTGEDGFAFRAELTRYVADPVCSPHAVLTAEVDLDPAWFSDLRANLAIIAAVDTDRAVISQDYLDETMPQFLDLDTGPGTRVPAWTTAHGSLHFASLTAPGLNLLSLERFGRAPSGYDAATLYTHSLLAPRTAARVFQEFAGVLNARAGRFAQLAVITELLDGCARGDNLQLHEALLERAQVLLGPSRIA